MPCVPHPLSDVWLLLFVHLVSKSLVRSAANDTEANLTIRFDIAYLLAFMMVLHCFKSAILTFTILKQALVRLLLQLCLLAGLLLFSVATFQSNGGLLASESSTTLLMLSTACLLLPELVADGGLLSSKTVEEVRGGGESEASAWVEAQTDDGRVYYYHKVTRETSWTRPERKEIHEPVVEAREGPAVDMALATDDVSFAVYEIPLFDCPGRSWRIAFIQEFPRAELPS